MNGQAMMVLLLSVPCSVTARALSAIEVDVLSQTALPRLLGAPRPVDGNDDSSGAFAIATPAAPPAV
jgi:hypothetical protein